MSRKKHSLLTNHKATDTDSLALFKRQHYNGVSNKHKGGTLTQGFCGTILAVFICVTHDRLSVRWTSRSLGNIRLNKQLFITGN